MSCKHRSGSCAGCSGCAGCLELTSGELAFLDQLAQFPFLPVARKADDMTPVYLEDQLHTPDEYSLILQCLETKGLIRMDYDAPLLGADMSAYKGYPVHGSIALTQRGQTVLELLDAQGITE